MAKEERNGRSKGGGRFVRLDHAQISTQAYRALGLGARALLVDLVMLENGKNNGLLYLSVRDAAALLGVSDHRVAGKALDELEAMGFIAMTGDAHFSVKAGDGSRARCWRLTWLSVPGKSLGPTNEYLERTPDGKQAQARAQRGCEALKRRQRKQNAVENFPPRWADRVEKLPPTALKKRGNAPVSVEESTTGNARKSDVSADFRWCEKLPTYSLPATTADPVAPLQGMKGTGGNALDPLREHVAGYIARSPVGTQTALAKAAGIPGGSLSKFLGGKQLAATHVAALMLELKGLDSRAA